MKYVVARVYKKRKLFLDIPFIFPDLVVHSVAFDAIKTALLVQYPADQGFTVRPLSAGFFSSLDLIGVTCHGESETLNVKSRGEKDGKLMRMTDYGSCMTF